jgi:hypothetical protein
LTPDHLTLLLENVKGKHDSVIRAGYQLIIDVTASLDSEACMTLFNALTSVTITDWDEKLVDTLKEFSIKAVGASRAEGPKLYALPIFYEQILDSSAVPTALSETIQLALCELLQHYTYSDQKQNYLQLCFDNLVHNQSVPQSLYIAKSVIESYNDNTTNFRGPTR